MQIIEHRVNTLEQYRTVPAHHGVEIDVRYHQNDLILHHDPFGHHEEPAPLKLTALLKNWRYTGPIILNVKTEGIELKCIELMHEYQIKQWFFLDMSMPYLAKYAYQAVSGEIPGLKPEHLAVRFSEREALAYALAFAGKAEWLWVDCFTRMPLNRENALLIKKAGFKICLVSPELQRHDKERIAEFQQTLQQENITLDAVCTKYPLLWKHHENQIS